MAKSTHPSLNLSRRERQIMDVLFRNGPSTVAEVKDRLPDGPGYSAVRALLRILEEKGHARHEKVGPRYVYQSVMPKTEAGQKVLSHTLATYFKGSASDMIAALLYSKEVSVSEEEMARLERLMDSLRRSNESS
ncbi:MAG: BlaI/MecI/CopY family transcriptional regulator [Rhodothermales bacterium]